MTRITPASALVHPYKEEQRQAPCRPQQEDTGEAPLLLGGRSRLGSGSWGLAGYSLHRNKVRARIMPGNWRLPHTLPPKNRLGWRQSLGQTRTWLARGQRSANDCRVCKELQSSNPPKSHIGIDDRRSPKCCIKLTQNTENR